MHRAGVAEGLFLSSGIAAGGVRTQDRLIDTAEILRRRHAFCGYLHLKLMPGLERDQLLRAMQLANRVSINLLARNTERLRRLAPHKIFIEELLQPLQWADEIRRTRAPQDTLFGRWPSLVTQMVVGGAGESDLEILTTTAHLTQRLRLAPVVSFEPYREQFHRLIPNDNFAYMEAYNASEGFFAVQSDLREPGLLLLLQNGIYYEFLPIEEWEKENPIAVPLSQVETGRHYAPIISTNAGLWRYMPGDVVEFTSLAPYKIHITGRKRQFVNAFGEEVMVSNTDKALAMTCREMDVIVSEYTVAPVYFKQNGTGGHEWIVEFDKAPEDIEAFNNLLDTTLQKINSDYEAKRFKGLAMQRLKLRIVPRGTFLRWLKSKGKFGGQHKVPRLSNDRRYVEEILRLVGGG